jgi:hypothetical protein
MTILEKQLFEKAEFLFGCRDGEVADYEVEKNFTPSEIGILSDMKAISKTIGYRTYQWIWTWKKATNSDLA